MADDVNYVVVVHLVPQDTTLEEWLHVATEAYKLRQSIVFSADDAKRLVAPAQPGSQVIVWAPQRWTAGDIVAYLGVACELRQFPAKLPELYAWYLYPDVIPYRAHNAIAAGNNPAATQSFSQPT
jgi:hypothetical protein